MLYVIILFVIGFTRKYRKQHVGEVVVVVVVVVTTTTFYVTLIHSII